MMPRLGNKLEFDIRDFINGTPTDACIIFPARPKKDGYTHCHYYGIKMPAHRAAYIHSNGPIPAGLFICHRCDVRSCINPRHLFIGTAADNNRDCISKGRANRVRKLTEDQVRSILQEQESCRRAGAKYGVTRQTIKNIRAGKIWRHIPRNGGPSCR